jgi:hypothetical protein
MLGRVSGREWMLIVPGDHNDWRKAPGFEDWMSGLGGELQKAIVEDERRGALGSRNDDR